MEMVLVFLISCFIYLLFPDYNNTQRFLSILSYIRDEYDFLKESGRLQMLICFVDILV